MDDDPPYAASVPAGTLVGDHLRDDVPRLSATGAVEQLRDSGQDLGIVLDSDRRPVQLLTPHGPAPLATVDAALPMDALVDDAVVQLIDEGAAALVVTGSGGRYLGVLTAARLADYLADTAAVATTDMGAPPDAPPIDVQLPGAQGPLEPLEPRCATCVASNRVPYLVPGQTQCRNGHVLVVTWE